MCYNIVGDIMRYKDAKRASILGIMGNLFLFVIKIIVGIMSNSQAMIADAVNSGSDVFNSFMTFIGNKIASKGADKDHNLGHGKAEYIFSMLISITMILVGTKILYESFMSLLLNNKIIFSKWLILICIINIIIKIILFLYTKHISKKHNNLLIKANSLDHRNDAIITTTNLISIIFTANNISYIDGLVGIGISLYIILTALNIFKDSYDILMDKAISIETKKQVLDIINNNKEVKGFRHFTSIPVGYQYQVSFTIFVDGNLSTYDSHMIADKLEKEITTKVDEIYLVLIHVNPYEEK